MFHSARLFHQHEERRRQKLSAEHHFIPPLRDFRYRARRGSPHLLNSFIQLPPHLDCANQNATAPVRSAIGHPVVGDPVYRPKDRPRCKAQFHRQALHAQTLGFHHPFTGQDVRVEAPLPPDLGALIVDLRNRYGIPGAGG